MTAVTLSGAAAVAVMLILAIFTGALPPVFGLAAITVVVTTIFWHLRTHLASVLLVFCVVLLATVVLGQQRPKLFSERIDGQGSDKLAQTWAASGAFDEGLPIVLHLVFDEMMSAGAISDDLPGGADARQALHELAAAHGLRLFDSVYSRYFFSGEALPNMMNPEFEGRAKLSEIFTEQQKTHVDNTYFDSLAARGYRTAVFQTSLMDFCANGQVDLCETFDSYDPGGGGDDDRDVRNRTAALWQTVLRSYEPSYLSEFGQRVLSRAYGLRDRKMGVLGVEDRYDAQRFPAWFDRFASFAATVPRGTHLFAHFMVPHAPYLLTDECIVSGDIDAGYYLARYSEPDRREKRRRHYESYLAQLRCVQQKLGDLLTMLGRAEQFDDAIIVIHGDHGSRISSGNILEQYSRQDFVDNYATFFALKMPGVAPGVDCEFVSLPQLFRRHLARSPAPAAGGDKALPVVVVSQAAGRAKVEAPMPPFGCATEHRDEQ